MDKNNSSDDKESKKRRDNPLDWSKYMTAKRDKLFKQFNERTDQNSDQNNGLNQLFSGICIYVNGVINPSEMELKTMVTNCGGMYLNHFDPKRTTHTIAQNLPFAKTKRLNDKKIVVKPQWILDSIEAKQLLPTEDYMVVKRDSNLRQYLNKPIKLNGEVVEDIQHILTSNETIDETIDETVVDLNEDSVEELRVEPQMTTTCETVAVGGDESTVNFDRNNYIPDSLSKIDPKFLDSLPMSLRNEILKDMNIPINSVNSNSSDKQLKRKDIKKTNDSNKKLAKEWHKNGFTRLMSGRPQDKKPVNKCLPTTAITANICGKTRLEDVIPLFEEWVNTEKQLFDEDIAYVTKYFLDLIDEQKYNHLIDILTKIFEFIDKRDETLWKHSYNDIRNIIISETKTNCNQNSEQINNLPHFEIN